LQRVMGADTYWNAPYLWEALFPVPLPGEKPGDPQPRIEAAKQWTQALYGAVPEALAGHAMFSEEIEEETFAVEMSFRWTVASVFAYVQSYIRWIESHSVVPTYRYAKRLLQALQWQRGAQRPWLLKAPWHLGFLDAIVDVFPDITIVQTNRDPAESVASSAALMYQGRKMGNPSADKHALGEEVLAMLSRQMRAHLRQRAALAKDPTIDVDYLTVVKDSVGVARRIHAARGSTLSAEGEQRMLAWERDNGQHKYGKFVYSAEEFGLDAKRIRAAFSEYCTKFGYG
jgi:Sulfotransferase family